MGVLWKMENKRVENGFSYRFLGKSSMLAGRVGDDAKHLPLQYIRNALMKRKKQQHEEDETKSNRWQLLKND